jgi:hypothetical protein
MFPDVGCPQGRLMKLNWHDRPDEQARGWRNVLMKLVVDRSMIIRPLGFATSSLFDDAAM